MSSSFLNRAFGLRDYAYVKTVYRGSSVYFHIADRRPRCSVCGSEEVVKDGTYERTIRLPPIGLRPVFAVLPVSRLRCRSCGVKRQAEVRFAAPMKSYSKAFARLVVELLGHCSVGFVAKFLGIGWDTVKDIHKRHLRKKYAKPPLKNLRVIAIDEMYLGKTLGYRTMVLDLTSGAVVYVGKGKDADALLPFWKSLKSSGARVEAVAMDMSKAYVLAVTKHLPDADIVFDPFHVIKLMNEHLDEIRRDIWRSAVDKADKKAIKGTRWILLRGRENLSSEPGKNGKASETELLEDALSLNAPLATAYYLKEDLRMLWLMSDLKSAKAWLRDWLKEAEASGIEQMKKMAATIRAHRDGILAYFTHNITSGPMEGNNNKVRTMMKQTYGLRDEEYLELRIKSLHEVKLRLVGYR